MRPSLSEVDAGSKIGEFSTSTSTNSIHNFRVGASRKQYAVSEMVLITARGTSIAITECGLFNGGPMC